MADYHVGQVLYRKPWSDLGPWRVKICEIKRSAIDGRAYAIIAEDDFGMRRTYELDPYGNIYGLQTTQPTTWDMRWERRAKNLARILFYLAVLSFLVYMITDSY